MFIKLSLSAALGLMISAPYAMGNHSPKKAKTTEQELAKTCDLAFQEFQTNDIRFSGTGAEVLKSCRAEIVDQKLLEILKAKVKTCDDEYRHAWNNFQWSINHAVNHNICVATSAFTIWKNREQSNLQSQVLENELLQKKDSVRSLWQSRNGRLMASFPNSIEEQTQAVNTP